MSSFNDPFLKDLEDLSYSSQESDFNEEVKFDDLEYQ